MLVTYISHSKTDREKLLIILDMCEKCSDILFNMGLIDQFSNRYYMSKKIRLLNFINKNNNFEIIIHNSPEVIPLKINKDVMDNFLLRFQSGSIWFSLPKNIFFEQIKQHGQLKKVFIFFSQHINNT